MDWLILRDVLNTAQVPHIREWVGGRGGEGEWVYNAFRYRQPICVHSGPDRWPQQP